MTKATIFTVGVLTCLVGCGGTVTPSDLPTPTPSVTRTATSTPLPTATPTLGPGANIGFFGVLRADETLLEPVGYDEMGRPIYTRQSPSGFVLVIDAKPGTNGAPVGMSAFDYDPTDPSVRPDLQIQVTRALGDGSTEVCDNMIGNFGGVPGIDPPSYEETQAISDALNDLGCRFNDGTGQPKGRGPDSACVLYPDGEFRFVDPSATLEFCGSVSFPLRFQDGDTIVTARVRDMSGMIGPERQIVLRVTGF